jgi:leucyl-tRNA synthetase
MPGWAGSSFYWMRYMDAHNEKHSKESVDCYTLATNMQLDIYCISFLNKFKDKGFATEETFKN